MTYVEFFDVASVRNVLTALMDPPERVVLIGNSTKHMHTFINRYNRLFADRRIPVEFIPRSVSRSNLDNAVEQIEKIIDEYGPCIFDITGGDEILNMALGVVYTKRPQDVRFHRITLEKNTVHDCDKDGVTIHTTPPDLTVEENVNIYGGDVVVGDVESDDTWYYDLNEDFLESARLMWEVCVDEGLKKWSRQVNAFEAVIKTGVASPDGSTVTALRSDVDKYLLETNRVYRKEQEIIDGLLDCGCLMDFDDTHPGRITVSFRDLQVRRVLSRAGTVLEMKVYLTLLEPDMGYTDCLTGVKIDWDGKREDDPEIIETDNEVDVLAMHGAVPIFISCKNGYMEADELYKLETVARRFGGPYAKTVLVANAIPDNKYGNAIRDRAKAMKIHLVERIHLMTEEELKEKLDHLWEIP